MRDLFGRIALILIGLAFLLGKSFSSENLVTAAGPICGQIVWYTPAGQTGVKFSRFGLTPCGSNTTYSLAAAPGISSQDIGKTVRFSDAIIVSISPIKTEDKGQITQQVQSWSRLESITSCQACGSQSSSVTGDKWYTASVNGQIVTSWDNNQSNTPVLLICGQSKPRVHSPNNPAGTKDGTELNVGAYYHFDNVELQDYGASGGFSGWYRLGPSTSHYPISGCSTQPPSNVPAQPPAKAEISFFAEPDTIHAGDCTTLRWDVENVRAAYVDGQGVTGHESRNVCPAATTTYTLRVVTNSGEDNRTATVNVIPVPPPPAPVPVSVNFVVDLDRIPQGDCASLRWDVEGVQAVYLDEQGVDGHDNRRVCPSATTEYTLKAMTTNGDVTKKILLSVDVPIRSAAFTLAGQWSLAHRCNSSDAIVVLSSSHDKYVLWTYPLAFDPFRQVGSSVILRNVTLITGANQTLCTQEFGSLPTIRLASAADVQAAEPPADKSASPRKALILLAGLNTNWYQLKGTYGLILSRTAGQYTDIIYFSYSGDPQGYFAQDTYKSVWDSSQVLRNTVEEYLRKYPEARIDAIGHSLGGVVAFTFVSQYGLREPISHHLGYWITLDSPVNGAIHLKEYRLDHVIAEVLSGALERKFDPKGVNSQAALDLAVMAQDRENVAFGNVRTATVLRDVAGTTVWTLTNADDFFITPEDAVVQGFGFKCSLGRNKSGDGHGEIFMRDELAQDIGGLLSGQKQMSHCPGAGNGSW